MSKKTDVVSYINAIRTGDNINNCRKLRGLSQATFARKLGVTVKTVSNWEQGHTSFTLEHLGLMCRILRVTANDILCFDAEDVIPFYIYSFFTNPSQLFFVCGGDLYIVYFLSTTKKKSFHGHYRFNFVT